MFKIDNYGKISLTRGDSAQFQIEWEKGFLPGDTIRLTVKKDLEDVSPLFSIAVPIEGPNLTSPFFRIESSYTKDAEFGNYYYDIELTRNVEGFTEPYVETIHGPYEFVLTMEVS